MFTERLMKLAPSRHSINVIIILITKIIFTLASSNMLINEVDKSDLKEAKPEVLVSQGA